MTWKQLVGKVREGLTESGARLRVLGDLLTDVCEGNGLLDHEQTSTVVIGLALAVSDLHTTIEHLAIGVDALHELLSRVYKSQEVEDG